MTSIARIKSDKLQQVKVQAQHGGQSSGQEIRPAAQRVPGESQEDR